MGDSSSLVIGLFGLAAKWIARKTFKTELSEFEQATWGIALLIVLFVALVAAIKYL